jgi:hypothetical protein
MGRRAQTSRGLASLCLSIALLTAIGAGTAQAAATKSVRYHGYTVKVPRSWPVYKLGRSPETCVRFDRHALYLGAPSPTQRCPAHAVGRTEAILVSPATAQAGRSAPRAAAPALPPDGKATSFVVAPAGVTVTATWDRHPGLVSTALQRRTLPREARASAPRAASGSPRARAASGVYTGLGFDACSTPSERQMSAWRSSPYQALGVYLGGVNAACSQPNLTSSWVADEVAVGWHLIPTYVGLQAPSNSCGCASITPSQAAAQGAAAATDAVNDAQAVSIPAGNPIYFDMEAYSRGGSNSSSVLSFLSAWTSRLHALGYLSGIYSSGASGITDLVNARGTSFVEPDDIWFAEWNGSQSMSSGYIPAGAWSNHQRIHQYNGGHDETYGGVTINIDGDSLDGATADNSSATVSGSTAPQPTLPTSPPALDVSPTTSGITNFSASWAGAIGVTGWRVLGGESSTSMSGVATARYRGAVTRLAIRTAAPYFALQALGSANQVLGTSAVVAAPAHLVIYGNSAFLPGLVGGLGAVPVGCYTGQACRISTTLTSGRTVVARTGPEYVGSGGAGLVYFRLTPAGTRLLVRSATHNLTVQALVSDGASGQTGAAQLALIPFFSTGRAAVAQLTQSPTLKLVGLTHFVRGGTGWILTGCMGAPTCAVTTTLSVGPTVIARTGPEIVGADQLRYLTFNLTGQGRAMLARARGNNLLVRATLAVNSGTPSVITTAARVSLVQLR